MIVIILMLLGLPAYNNNINFYNNVSIKKNTEYLDDKQFASKIKV